MTYGVNRCVRRVNIISTLALAAIGLVWASKSFADNTKPTPIRDLYSDTWVASDGLGREVSGADTPRGLRADKTVGVFYFVANRMPGYPIYDNTQIIAANPSEPKYGPAGATHWWGEPWLGYYQSDDPAVIRKHMQMLANAGVDVVIFDNTNGAPWTYPITREAICKVLTAMRAEGNKTPSIAFFTNGASAQKVYEDFYAKNEYRDLWYMWQGKPLMMVTCGNSTGRLSPEVKSFFTLRRSWAWTPSQWFGDGRDAWPWLDNWPQNYGWHDDPAKPEEISVVVSQHASSSIGRSYHNKSQPPVNSLRITDDSAKGICFDEQWKRALTVDPQFVFVTGWNEWTATRFSSPTPGRLAGVNYPAGGSFFVDEYNEEFSRDIEPEKGRLRDNYYYQFAEFVRKYKGARQLPPVMKKAIHLNKGFEEWNTVQPEYRDAEGDAVHRDFPGWADKHYTNFSGRNDIVAAKVAYDKNNVYFYVRTKAPITKHTDPSWMLLFINSDANYKTGWLGYDFVVNQSGIADKETTLSQNVGNAYSWKPVQKLAYRVDRNQLEIAIPRKFLGIDRLPATLYIKWADNIAQNGDSSDFTLNGDTAPDDRFNYLVKLDK